jgi:isopenicillin-N epimerase
MGSFRRRRIVGLMEWQLDPSVRHLNHGAFGAVPREVADHQALIRREIAANPTRFLARELESKLDGARHVLAGFVGAAPETMAWVDNATTGVNAVLQMFARRLSPADEILVTDHEYNACRNAIDAIAVRSGAVVREVPIPFPFGKSEELFEAVLSGVTARTRLVVIDHITSQSAIVLPVERLVAEIEGAGIPVLVDGAHGPGMIALDLEKLGASFYVGNCHKWLCAPHGAAFLRVSDSYREEIEPVIVSHGWNDPRPDRDRFRKMFDWTGTDDPSAVLSVPAAIDTIGTALPGGWSEVMATNRALALVGRRIVLDRLGLQPPVPDEMVGSMATVILPPGQMDGLGIIDPLGGEIFESHRIEVPVFSFPRGSGRVVRMSAQLYNSVDDYEALADALEAHLG